MQMGYAYAKQYGGSQPTITQNLSFQSPRTPTASPSDAGCPRPKEAPTKVRTTARDQNPGGAMGRPYGIGTGPSCSPMMEK